MLGKFKLAPFLLIALGVIFLLNNFGVLPWSIWTNLWKFWPVILILIGVEYLIGQSISLKTTVLLLLLIFLIPIIVAVNPFTKNPLATEELAISEELGSLTKAKIIIDLPATNLNIDSSTASAKLVEGKISFSKAAEKPEVSNEESLGQGIFRLTQKSTSGIPIISSIRNNTNLLLTQQIPLEIQINTGASKEKLDLSKLRIDYLEINSQASDLNIIFGSLYSARVRIKTSASTLSIKIPNEIEARIKIDSKVKSLSIADRFKKKGGAYESTDFDKAFTRLDIEIDSVAGSITIK
ncbi:MAG: hypothetical protein A2Z24_01120 [Candidatus Woykebacteria bacterium RBG_16_44_10]|uniref:DUF5668 domain-containing protein n=1 Tax=Candidatus Woykebacteria bacterium RBG_16_44_10 TaxID=1802597 RepID=A0A1G1WGJ8_9BACT|nr:MAG: hypothetical protein A2Z24_01120 [Candidatus Woykebacteria bacterium RBG_16_44_10]